MQNANNLLNSKKTEKNAMIKTLKHKRGTTKSLSDLMISSLENNYATANTHTKTK